MRVVAGSSLGLERPPDDGGVNAVRVATVGVKCCGCRQSGENESQERERAALKLLSRIIIQPSSMGTLGDTEL